MKEATVNELRELLKAYNFFLDESNKDKRFDGWMTYPEFLSEVGSVSGKTVKEDNLKDAIQVIKIAIESGTLPTNTTPAQLDELVEKMETQEKQSGKIRAREEKQVEKWVQTLKTISVVPVNPAQATTISADTVQALKTTSAEAAKNPGKFIDKFVKNIINPTSMAAKTLPPQQVAEVLAPPVALDVVKDLQDIEPVFRKLPKEKTAIFLPRENPMGVIASLTDIDSPILTRAIPDKAQREIFVRETAKPVVAMAAYGDIKKAFVAAYPNLGYGSAEFLYPSLPGGKIPSYREPQNQEEEKRGIKVDLKEIYKIAQAFSRASETATQQVAANGGYTYFQQTIGGFAKEIGVKEIPIVKPATWETLLGLPVEQTIPLLGGAIGVYGSQAFISPLLSAYSAQMLLQAPQIALLGAMAGQGITGGAIVAAGSNVQTILNITLGQNYLRAGLAVGAGNLAGKYALGIEAQVGAHAARAIVGLSSQTAARIGSALAFLANPIVGFIAGIVGGWAIPKIAGLIKKYIVPIFVILGGVVGFVILGPIGLIGGGILGGVAAGGITGGSLGAGVATVTGAFAALGGAFASTLAVPFVIALIGIPVLVAFILFIINSGAYVLPGSSTSISTIPSGGFPGVVRCTQEAVPLPFSNTTASPIANRAWVIMNNMLQGFWCYWNKSPDYPELFNEQVYEQDPNPSYPGPIQGCPHCMFWCTWLIMKSYQENGSSIPFRAEDVGVGNMIGTFKGVNKFISVSEATPANVVPGSAVFFEKYNVITQKYDFTHVGLVYSVSQDAIVFVQSNAPTKSSTLTFNANGIGVQGLGSLLVYGFGTP